MQLDPDFSEFIGCLLDAEVQFLVVGGHAVGIHGHPRYTGDLDLWVLVDRMNAGRILAALEVFGMGDLGLAAEDFLEPDRVVQIGFPPLRIDIVTSIDGVEFDEAWPGRLMVDVDGGAVPIIGLEHLLRNKRASGRAQDLADVEALDP